MTTCKTKVRTKLNTGRKKRKLVEDQPQNNEGGKKRRNIKRRTNLNRKSKMMRKMEKQDQPSKR